VARSSRTRRNRRRSDDYQAPASAPRARDQRAAPVRPAQTAKSQTGAQRERGGGARGFIGESWAELKKVEWPGRRQLASATVVVIIAIAVVGTYLAIADYAFSHLVRDVLLRF
jgi:preprotein translocase subunit SecE